MSLRPRYSLLTLLVLTALVAGGVKLWYGPHHVVERSLLTIEEEYTFTRDWSGSKNIHGVKITRHDLVAGAKSQINFTYFRHGQSTNEQNSIAVDSALKKYYACTWLAYFESKLSSQECDEFFHVMQNECLRLRGQGFNECDDAESFEYFLGRLP